jgi:VWFA-related protein
MPSLTTIRAFALVIVASVVTCAAEVRAQAPPAVAEKAFASPVSPAPPDLPSTETIRKNVDEVNVVFTVTNAGGQFVSKLSLQDLEVLDNQRPPEKISYFGQQSEMPLRVALLVDLSDSIVNRFNYEKKAAAAFLKKVLRPGVDQAFLVGFGSEVKLLQDFTSDIDKLSQAVRGMKVGGNTKLYDAILFASAKLQRETDTGATRRAIVIISDGVDTFSRGLFYDTTRATLRTQATIYALSTNNVSQDGYTKGEAVLDLLTQPTGGTVLPANTQGEMARAFEKIKEALHSQYVIGYKPAGFQPDGTFRSIKIVPHNRKMVVNCRRGYFAPREERDSASHALAP